MDEVLDKYTEGKLEYQKDKVMLVVEDIEGKMVITHTIMDAQDVFELVVFMIGKLSDYTGMKYNDIVKDLMEKESK